MWATLVGVPLTKIAAASNGVVGQWYGRGGDAVCFGYGSVWLVDYNDGLVWRINPNTASANVRVHKVDRG